MVMSKEAVLHLSRADKILARHIAKIGPCGLKRRARRSPFEALVRAVAYQQLNGTAAAAILGRVKALYPPPFPTPQDLLDTPNEKLRGAGLSRAKIAAIKDIAAKTIEGIVPTARAIARMENTVILERLTAIRGVGPWTVEMLLMFTLGRMDVLPVTDYGVRKGFQLLYELDELPAPKELLAHGEKWKPYRSIAAWYLWRAVDQQGGT